jgi:hypothetical protein
MWLYNTLSDILEHLGGINIASKDELHGKECSNQGNSLQGVSVMVMLSFSTETLTLTLFILAELLSNCMKMGPTAPESSPVRLAYSGAARSDALAARTSSFLQRFSLRRLCWGQCF